MRVKQNDGFTVLEIMVVVIILGILANFAIYFYQNNEYKTRRVEATSALTSAAQKLERFHTVNNTYVGAMFGSGDGSIYPDVFTTPNGYYTLSFRAQGASNYTLQATPREGQTNDPCGALTLNDQGQRGITGSGNINRCWSGNPIH
ncbi:MAG: type IV pilin protein [Nitrospiria bacterium]